MSSDWARGMFDRLTINPRRTTAAAARKKSMQEAIPGLPDHLVVTHILRPEYFDDPADLTRLRLVSRAMRDTVAAKRRRCKDLCEQFPVGAVRQNSGLDERESDRLINKFIKPHLGCSY